MVEKGNHVVFGLGDDDNFILNRKSGGKLMLRPNGRGSYLMQVAVVGGGSTENTVDSGISMPMGVGATIWMQSS
eukprot:6247690-Karenia_brevis.AAC.1